MRQKTTSLPLLRDLDQPFVYDIRMYNRPYRFEFYDTASPENYTLLRPDFIVLCFSIDGRQSLVNVQQVWFKEAVQCYMRERDDIPIMVLGLKRDLRKEEAGVIYPQEVSSWVYRSGVADVNHVFRASESLKTCAVTGMPSAQPRPAS